jgi:hypothetical protein
MHMGALSKWLASVDQAKRTRRGIRALKMFSWCLEEPEQAVLNSSFRI